MKYYLESEMGKILELPEVAISSVLSVYSYKTKSFSNFYDLTLHLIMNGIVYDIYPNIPRNFRIRNWWEE